MSTGSQANNNEDVNNEAPDGDGAVGESLSASVAADVNRETFNSWHNEELAQQNLAEGKGWANGNQPPVTAPRRHSPYRLNKCQRAVAYKEQNAPVETEDPQGIFWIGDQVEQELAEDYLEWVARSYRDENIYVQNDMYVDATINTKIGKLTIRGSTDPVVVDEVGTPIMPAEIKTKSDNAWYYLDEDDPTPDPPHKAQLMAYMRGLEKTTDVDEIRQGVVMYVNKKTLEVAVSTVSWDEEYWQSVVDWMISETEARLSDELPPAEPNQDWECEYCDYEERCGQTDSPVNDAPVTGLVPNVEYPKEKIKQYIATHQDVMLTPTVAHQHPELARDMGVYDWCCDVCGERFEWDESVVDIIALPDPPQCPECGSALGGPLPSEQGHDHAHSGDN